MLEVPKKKADLVKMSLTDLKKMCDLHKVLCQPSGRKGFVKTDYVDALYTYANPGTRPPVARSGGGSKNSASVVGEEGGGAKGKCTSKEWNNQQAKATQALKAEYFDILPSSLCLCDAPACVVKSLTPALLERLAPSI